MVSLGYGLGIGLGCRVSFRSGSGLGSLVLIDSQYAGLHVDTIAN